MPHICTYMSHINTYMFFLTYMQYMCEHICCIYATYMQAYMWHICEHICCNNYFLYMQTYMFLYVTIYAAYMLHISYDKLTSAIYGTYMFDLNAQSNIVLYISIRSLPVKVKIIISETWFQIFLKEVKIHDRAHI